MITKVMNWPRKRWRLFATGSVVFLALILFWARRYGDAQVADSAAEFRGVFGPGEWLHYLIAACADVLFATSYGLLAIAIGWPTGNNWPAKIRRFGALLVFGGAFFDVLENAALIHNVMTYRTVDDGWIGHMTDCGRVKWAAIELGLLIVGLCALISPLLVPSTRQKIRDWLRVSRDRVGAWIKKSWFAYLLYIGAVVAFVPIAWGVLPGWLARILAIVFVAGLALLGSRLNSLVTADRGHAPSPSRARLILGTGQLVVGLMLVWAAGDADSRLAGLAFFVGLALVVMSMGSCVSELRLTKGFQHKRGPALFVLAVALLFCGTLVGTGWLLVGLVAGGLLAGELGAELASEDFQDATLPTSGWKLSLVGVFVAVVGASLLIVAGTDPSHALILLVVLGMLAVMASVGGDGLVVVLVLAIVLVWATSPDPASRDPVTEVAKDQPYFAVLGDSYMSGEGATEFIKGTNEVHHGKRGANDDYTNECRQAPTAWPFKIAHNAIEKPPIENFPSHVLFLACSGAVTENIDEAPRLDKDHNQHGPAEVALLKRRIEARRRARYAHVMPDFVLVSIGGNDAGFGDLGQSCISPGNCAEVAEQFLRTRRIAKPEPSQGQAEPVNQISDDLDRAYGRIKGVVGKTPVIAVSYPMPVDAAGRCPGVLFDADERVFIRGFLKELNKQVAAAATRADFKYMDMEKALTDRHAHLCSSVAGSAGLNFLALNSKGGTLKDSLLPSSWVHNSIHPNAIGHEALAAAAEKWFKDYWPDHVPPPPAKADAEVAPVDEVLHGAGVTQCDPATRPSCDINGYRWVIEQVHNLYSTVLMPLALVMFGLWLAMAPAIKWGRAQQLTLLKVISQGWERAGPVWRWLNGD